MVQRNSSRLGKILLGSSALAGTLLWAVPVFAQGGGSVETIVVTARHARRAFTTCPAQVTAFTAETIEAKGIQRPHDFISAVPNVTFVETQNAGTSFLVIRGISQARNSEPSAAIVIDGVPMTQPAQFNQELVDIQQIEVIKGPQGALYGRNAIGGAILITTKKPSDEWEGRVTAGYESGPGGKVQAVISGPLADIFKVRAARVLLQYRRPPDERQYSRCFGGGERRSSRGFEHARLRSSGADRQFHCGLASLGGPPEDTRALLRNP